MLTPKHLSVELRWSNQELGHRKYRDGLTLMQDPAHQLHGLEACTQARLITITLYPPGSEQLVCQEVMHRDTLKQVNGKLKPIFHDCFHPVPM